MNDLENMSVTELQELRGRIEKALIHAETRQRMAALAAVEEAARSHGFASVRSLLGEGRDVPALPKYVNPSDPSMTWTGRGRKPQWVEEALNTGKSLSELLSIWHRAPDDVPAQDPEMPKVKKPSKAKIKPSQEADESSSD